MGPRRTRPPGIEWALTGVAQDSEKTEYSIFCPTQTPQRCNLAGDTPFTFTEGSETLIFHGTSASTLYAPPTSARLPT
ncbi:hypothetical protein IMZ48_06710, partial [Candidatus Bathyarchaeota archaeon]|nr:hypothetical protein [Candidatus Bathyarchaeota archaeon]